MDVTEVVDVLMFCLRRAENFKVGLLSLIGNLGDTTTIDGVALKLQHVKRLVQLFPRDAKFPLHAGANVDHSLFSNLLFQEVGGLPGLVHPSLRTLIEQGADRGIILKSHLIRNLLQGLSLLTEPLDLCDVIGSAFILGEAKLSAELGGGQTHRLCDSGVTTPGLPILISKRKPLLAELVHPGKEVAAVLVGVIARTPGVAPGMPGCAIVHQHIVLFGVHGLTLLFFNLFKNPVEGNNLIHDGKNVRHSGLIDNDLIALVDAKLELDAGRFDPVFQTEQCSIDHKLFHMGGNLAGLKVVNAEQVLFE